MLQNYNKWRVLQVFFDYPLAEGGLQLREISRKAKLALPSVTAYLQELQKENLILKKKHRVQGYPTYAAHRESRGFRFYKKTDLLIRLHGSGLLQALQDTYMPESIILFGSAARGEDTENSDVDIFVGASEEKMALDKYEKILQRKIHLFFEPNFRKLSPELKNNLLNGVILSGYVKVF